MATIHVRPVRSEDREAIIRIDEQCTGARKEGWWRGYVEMYLASGATPGRELFPELFQVAESDGSVVGFMVGDVLSWQFGIERAGRIIAIGVDPAARRRGVASRLCGAMTDAFRRMGLAHVQCLAEPGGELDSFFRSNGFASSRFAVLDRGLGPEDT
jgi:ribosomal protein S18 acetylase RimI-like enzyme